MDYRTAEPIGIRGLRGARTAARLAELVELWEAGALRLEIAATFPLTHAADAHRLVEAVHVRGNAVITPCAAD